MLKKHFVNCFCTCLILFSSGILLADEKSDFLDRLHSFRENELKTGTVDDVKERVEEYEAKLREYISSTEGEEKEKFEKELQDLRNQFSRKVANQDIYDGNIGITFGFMFAHAGGGKASYIDDAKVDANGFIRSENSLHSFNTAMPSITLHWACRESFAADWACLPGEDSAIIGFTLGINPEGQVAGANGGMMALGLTWGYRITTEDDTYLFGLVLGGLWDNTIQVLPSDLPLDGFYPYYPQRTTIYTAPTTDDIMAYSAIELPTKTTNARYGFVGVVISANINFGGSD